MKSKCFVLQVTAEILREGGSTVWCAYDETFSIKIN